MQCRVKCFSLKFTQLSGAFSGLLAAAIENMNDVGGRPGWAWIFILVFLGIFFYLSQLIFNHFIGRIVHDSRRIYQFILYALYTPRFQVFS